MVKRSEWSAENLIEGLKVPAHAKEVLRHIDKLTASSNGAVKNSVKGLFVVSSSEAASLYAKCYEQLLMKNEFYKVVGKKSYLELSFPKNATEKEYRMFYSSPSFFAVTVNRYTGVFLCSFEQWNGVYELSREPAFSELLRFIDKNKDNISFVFHVLPAFSGRDELFGLLNSHINLVQTQLKTPEPEDAMTYVEAELKKADIFVEEEIREEMKDFVFGCMDAASDACVYQNLKLLAQNIIFETFCMGELEKGKRVIDRSVLCRLEEKVDFSFHETRQGIMGFTRR